MLPRVDIRPPRSIEPVRSHAIAGAVLLAGVDHFDHDELAAAIHLDVLPEMTMDDRALVPELSEQSQSLT